MQQIRELKGNIAEAGRKAAALLFAGPTENIRRTVTQVERYRVQKTGRGFREDRNRIKMLFVP